MSGRFVVYPAIDVRDGRVVRLHQGDYARETRYGDDPLALALRLCRRGCAAGCIWSISMRRATAATRCFRCSSAIKAQTGLRVQTGGGVREEDDVARLFDGGADRVVVGSLAAGDPARVAGWIETYRSRSPDDRARRASGRRRTLVAGHARLDLVGANTPWTSWCGSTAVSACATCCAPISRATAPCPVRTWPCTPCCGNGRRRSNCRLPAARAISTTCVFAERVSSLPADDTSEENLDLDLDLTRSDDRVSGRSNDTDDPEEEEEEEEEEEPNDEWEDAETLVEDEGQDVRIPSDEQNLLGEPDVGVAEEELAEDEETRDGQTSDFADLIEGLEETPRTRRRPRVARPRRSLRADPASASPAKPKPPAPTPPAPRARKESGPTPARKSPPPEVAKRSSGSHPTIKPTGATTPPAKKSTTTPPAMARPPAARGGSDRSLAPRIRPEEDRAGAAELRGPAPRGGRRVRRLGPARRSSG